MHDSDTTIEPTDHLPAVARARADTSWRTVARCLLVALAVMSLVLVRFTPRFGYWRGLYTPGVLQCEEYGRAKVTLEQIKDPWVVPSSQFHEHVRWRLFFPLLWHYLHLPDWSLLPVPALGCVAVLALVCWLTLARTGSWPVAVLATTAFAALPWFFVATGWLTYFDSWLMLAVLLTAFVPSRTAVGIACFVAPWIDERFVLALPLVVVARTVALNRYSSAARRDLLLDLATIAAASVPYLAMRTFDWLSGEGTTNYYVVSHWQEVKAEPFAQLLAGLWSGFRVDWFFVAAAIVLTARMAGWLWGVALACATALMIMIGLYISADMSRNLMAISPALLLGIWQWDAWRAGRLSWVLPAVVAAALVLPAAHVMWGLTTPISSLPTQIREWREPPPFFRAAELIQEADTLLNSGQTAAGRAKLNEALALARDYPDALVTRAGLLMQEGKYDDAYADLDYALQLKPQLPTGRFLRGVVLGSRGKTAEAAEDFRQALAGAPANWQFRAPAEEFLRQAEESLEAASRSRGP